MGEAILVGVGEEDHLVADPDHHQLMIRLTVITGLETHICGQMLILGSS